MHIAVHRFLHMSRVQKLKSLASLQSIFLLTNAERASCAPLVLTSPEVAVMVAPCPPPFRIQRPLYILLSLRGLKIHVQTWSRSGFVILGIVFFFSLAAGAVTLLLPMSSSVVERSAENASDSDSDSDVTTATLTFFFGGGASASESICGSFLFRGRRPTASR